jgi:diaminohydroxyphosphoribosylaminopyrimidine deaminase/5-amino-6-(5-phosphoribosylamino)uracil reductase
MGNRDVPAGSNLHDGIGETIFLQSHDSADLLDALESASVNQVLVEAGPTLGSALLAVGLIDEIVIYQAPKLLGAGKSWLEDIGVQSIGDVLTLSLITSEQIGPDFKFRYRVEKR